MTHSKFMKIQKRYLSLRTLHVNSDEKQNEVLKIIKTEGAEIRQRILKNKNIC